MSTPTNKTIQYVSNFLSGKGINKIPIFDPSYGIAAKPFIYQGVITDFDKAVEAYLRYLKYNEKYHDFLTLYTLLVNYINTGNLQVYSIVKWSGPPFNNGGYF